MEGTTSGGRRPGTTRTRTAILDAARELFAAQGFGGTTIRGIATAAGVDPALVHHFFGSKDDLFAAVLQVPEAVLGQLSGVLAAGPDGAGERLTRFYLGLYESADTRAAMLSMMRSAVAHEQAARVLRDVVTARVLAYADLLPDNARLRLELAMSHLTGLALARYVLGVAPAASADVDELVAWVAPAVQAYLTGPAPG